MYVQYCTVHVRYFCMVDGSAVLVGACGLSHVPRMYLCCTPPAVTTTTTTTTAGENPPVRLRPSMTYPSSLIPHPPSTIPHFHSRLPLWSLRSIRPACDATQRYGFFPISIPSCILFSPTSSSCALSYFSSITPVLTLESYRSSKPPVALFETCFFYLFLVPCVFYVFLPFVLLHEPSTPPQAKHASQIRSKEITELIR